MTTTPNLYRKIYLAIVAVALLLLVTGTTSAQWSPTASPTPTPGTNIYYNSGNVGIGTTDPSSYAKLAIRGGITASISGGSFTGVSLETSDAVNSSFYINHTSGVVNLISDAGLSLYTANGAGGAPIERVRILNSGNVGIGTTNPVDLMHLRGVNPQLRFQNTSGGSVGFSLYNDTPALIGSVLIDNSVGDIHLSPFGVSDAVIIKGSSGNVGIGTPYSNGKLNFQADSGSVLISSTRSDNTQQGYLASDGWGSWYTNRGLSVGYSLPGTCCFNGMIVNGSVGIGTQTPGSKLDVNGNTNISGNINVAGNGTTTGNITLDGTIHAKYQDVAEWVLTSEQIPLGTVVVLDSTKSNQVISSMQAYDTRVAGVVSERPGLALGESGANKVLVATTGRVLVKVDASNGPIHIGDLLVTSDIPGLAMKSEPITIGNRKMHMPGTLIGKALEPLEKGSGKILVLLSLQ